MDPELESKLKRLVRMIFQDLYVNLYAKKSSPPVSVKVGKWEIELAESNAGSLALACAGVETLGRCLLGKKLEKDVSGVCYAAFIDTFFPALNYNGKGKEIYKSYRCGFLHSHYLGFNSENGFCPIRGADNSKHLTYTNSRVNEFSSGKNIKCCRLVLHVDTFVQDFKTAVEDYISELNGNQGDRLLANLHKSLEGFLVDFDYADGRTD